MEHFLDDDDVGNVEIDAELLGFTDPILPFANATGTNILRGVNYAFGGGGIRDETGNKVVGRLISMNGQLANHQVTLSRIATLRRSTVDEAKEYVGNCIYSVGMGSNDYIDNYLMPQIYPTSTLFTPDQYAAALIKPYERQLRTLYTAGARKVALFEGGLIGCTPAEIATFGTNGSACADFINTYVTLFNTRLKTLVDRLDYDITDAKFIYINTTHIDSGEPSTTARNKVFDNADWSPVEDSNMMELSNAMSMLESVVFQDLSGAVLQAVVILKPFLTSLALLAEASCFRSAVGWARSFNFQKVCFESDAKLVVDFLIGADTLNNRSHDFQSLMIDAKITRLLMLLLPYQREVQIRICFSLLFLL
ncbi:GDSL esterase/lipase At5g45670-like [Cornus florida]|uniref:GDSL esterase/lipase At5g45670-like n=1 Tax=Cornus florida TaxID=4283 RepID=UPI0028A2A01D|nr:GDSL esterase/lipase At5g45670-like [Cornus florida]